MKIHFLHSAPSAVTDLTSITENSNSILIQWGLPQLPNGNISFYVVSSVVSTLNTQTSVPSGTFFFSLDGSPGDSITFMVHAEIGESPAIEGAMSEMQQTLNTTVPFLEAELVDNSIGTLTVSLPPASLYPDNGDIM